MKEFNWILICSTFKHHLLTPLSLGSCLEISGIGEEIVCRKTVVLYLICPTELIQHFVTNQLCFLLSAVSNTRFIAAVIERHAHSPERRRRYWGRSGTESDHGETFGHCPGPGLMIVLTALQVSVMLGARLTEPKQKPLLLIAPQQSSFDTLGQMILSSKEPVLSGW